MIHVGDVKGKEKMAKDALFMADEYMGALGHEISRLNEQRMTYDRVNQCIEKLLPVAKDATDVMASLS